jgi:multiple antibiotic resistance protein
MLTVLKYFGFTFSALLPLVNPLGSALIFLSVVRHAPDDLFQQLARKVAITTVIFLLVIELAGGGLLSFFGISLPVVQLAGGLVLAFMGASMLNSKDAHSDRDANKTSAAESSTGPLEDMVFYPLSFPITAGPGCVVVTLTLSAHASGHRLLDTVTGHLGIALAIVVLGVSVWLCYAYAQKIAEKVPPATVSGILRIISFVVLCIGVQIAWNGLEKMIEAMK